MRLRPFPVKTLPVSQAGRLLKVFGPWLMSLALAFPILARDVYRGFLDPAIPHHRAALKILADLEKDPLNAELKNDLACLIARDGFWRDAIREFEESAKLDKKLATKPYFNAGLVSLWRGEIGTARGYFKKSVKADPGNWPAWWMIGYTYERQGYDRSAIKNYARSMRVDTSLFNVTRNPYAADSRLKSQVLLLSYNARMTRAAQGYVEQLADRKGVLDLMTSKMSEAPNEKPAAVETAPAAPVAPAVKMMVPAMGSPVAPAPAPAPGGAPPTPQPQDVSPAPQRSFSSSRTLVPPGESPATAFQSGTNGPVQMPLEAPAGTAPDPSAAGPGPGMRGGTQKPPSPTPPPGE